ncbi:MAG: helix-turn-helix domain-containing protein [Muribaculaceae bacterium]
MANLQKIKDLSKAKGIPLKTIAEQVGISEQGIHKMIREETMSAVILEQIACILKVNICVFFNRERVCEHYEQYNVTAERAIAAKHIGKVDQRNILPKAGKGGQEDLEAKVMRLQDELLEAKNKIIELLEKK